IADEFICFIHKAMLNNKKLDPHVLECLCNPIEGPPNELDPDTQLSIDLYLSITHASEDTYNLICNAIHLCFPEFNILSYYKVKNLISDITDVVSISHNMCINSCHAFTGLFEDWETCFYCQEPWYDQDHLCCTGEKVPCQQFNTILLGPQLAAICHSSEGAKA
ncbi:hypothetical protein GYMLUDRAFT_180324, partial [Collybiopsis luxurians FD-317 M1]